MTLALKVCYYTDNSYLAENSVKIVKAGILGCMLAALLLGGFGSHVYAANSVVVPSIGVPPAPMAPQRSVVISAFQATGGPQFIELYNYDTAPASVDGWHATARFDDTSECDIALHGYVLSKKQVLAVQQSSLPTAANAERFDCHVADSAVLTSLDMYDHDTLAERVVVPAQATQLWQRKGLTATYRTGDFSKDFVPFAADHLLPDDAWYTLPPAPALTITEVLVAPRGCVPSELAADCYDYVKLKNTGTEPIDLGQYRLRSGFANTAPSSTNTAQLAGLLEPGTTTRIDHDATGVPINITANDGTVWLEDNYGLTTFDLGVPPYVGSDLASHKGQSWAFDESDATWKWAIPSPDSAGNTFPDPLPVKVTTTSVLTPCAANQYRSADTNRCRLIATASSDLTPCKIGQERNPETNRCHSVASIASAMTPCKVGQERNPDTNRCRAVATAANALKTCAEGQERNPETNRCRKIQTTVTSADFAVEPVKQGAKSFVGWWALGGLGVLAAGYGVWEWRDEIKRTIRRLPLYVSGSK